jgi:hypothetical protein
LTDELQVVTGFQTPPPPSIADLGRMARRERGRSRRKQLGGFALAAAAVAAAVVIGIHVGRPDAAPGPVHPYYAPGVPYVQDGTLYIDHERQPGEWTYAVSFGDHTLAVATDQTGEILRDGVQVLRIDGPILTSSLSDDGTKAVWVISKGKQSGVLVARDLVGGRETGRLPLALPAHGNQGPDVSAWIDDSGVVHYRIDARGWSWEPGHDPAPEQYVDQELPQTTGFAEANGRAVLSPDQLWGAWMTDRNGQLTDTGPFTGLTVQKPGDPDSRFTIPLPGATDSGAILWRSPTRLAYGVADYQLCDIAERWCKDYSKTDAK